MKTPRSAPAIIALSAAALIGAGATGAAADRLIGSRQIKNDSVRSVDVKDGALRSIDIKNGSVGLRDLNAFTKGKIKDRAANVEPGVPGPAGASAYQVAVEEGFNGTQQEWLASLVGNAGPRGVAGPTGEAGAPGERGPAGPATTRTFLMSLENGAHEQVLFGGLRFLGVCSDGQDQLTINSQSGVWNLMTDGGEPTKVVESSLSRIFFSSDLPATKALQLFNEAGDAAASVTAGFYRGDAHCTFILTIDVTG